MIFTILYFYNFLQFYTGYRYYRNDNEISLHETHFYELQFLASSESIIYLWPDDGLVREAETCCHLVTLNKINIHDVVCVLTCESLLLTCIHRTQRGWITRKWDPVSSKCIRIFILKCSKASLMMTSRGRNM